LHNFFINQNYYDEIDAMGYDWDESHRKFSFFLDPEVPYVVGAYAPATLQRLLAGTAYFSCGY
jgi:alkylresorcinol/alkylpyrone synthase/polyketide synthase Type III